MKIMTLAAILILAIGCTNNFTYNEVVNESAHGRFSVKSRRDVATLTMVALSIALFGCQLIATLEPAR